MAAIQASGELEENDGVGVRVGGAAHQGLLLECPASWCCSPDHGCSSVPDVVVCLDPGVVELLAEALPVQDGLVNSGAEEAGW
eukprot:1156867-Rhodomonas_salina.1